MSKLKIAYIVSTLGNSGPTRQLYHIVGGLDPSKFESLVITLSPEPGSSLLPTFLEAGIEVKTLGLGRVGGLLHARRRLVSLLAGFGPDILHSQGLRADALAQRLPYRRWVATARNYPFDDYPMKFGRFRGYLMARAHMATLRRCPALVACSDSIRTQLGAHGVVARTIRNGVPMGQGREVPDAAVEEGRQFIVSGALIERKNVAYIIAAFNALDRDLPVRLLVLGDGPGREKLERMANSDNVSFLGHVADVGPYLRVGTVLISASRSEGMPNAVLEGFAAGCPAILSDIPSHREVHGAAMAATKLFPLDDHGVELKKLISQVAAGQLRFSRDATSAAAETFSAGRMSRAYGALYEELSAGE